MPYLIPDVIDPGTSVCVMVHVPNDENHIRAFWGALDTLGKHWNWDNQVPATTSPVSIVWQKVIRTAHANMGDCEVHTHTLRQTDCTIELLIDGELVASVKLDPEKCNLLNQGGDGTKIVAPGITEADKKTALFSGAMALVIYCQEAIIDAFNAIEAEIEIGKAATVWMETVPGLDLSPAHEILTACDDFNEMLESVFEATDTPEWREQMSCKIMCWCVENEYTFDASIVDRLREYLTDQGLSAPDYFYSNFVDVATYKALIDRFSLGLNDEDEDWIALCDVCLKFFGQVTFDDAETDLDYEVTFGTVESVGNPDLGLQGAFYTEPPYATGRKAEIRIDLGEDVHVKAVMFDYNYKVFITGELRRIVRLYDNAEVLLDTFDVLDGQPLQEWHTQQADFDEEDVRYVEVELRMISDYTGTQWIYMDNIRVFEEEV